MPLRVNIRSFMDAMKGRHLVPRRFPRTLPSLFKKGLVSGFF